MRDIHLTAIVVLVCAVIGLGIFYGLNGQVETEASGNVTNQTVWDCSFENNDTCVKTEISSYQDCRNENGVPELDACRSSSEDLEDITMFTDRGNYLNAPITDEEYTVETVDIGANNAWDADFLENGNMMYTEQEGNLTMYDGEDIVQEAKVDNTVKFGNTGLLGVDADPDFKDNNYVYLYYFAYRENRTVEVNVTDQIDPIYNRVSRFEFRNNTLVNEKVLIDRIPGSSGHSGGRIEVGPDGHVYVTTGDSEFLKTDALGLHDKAQKLDFLGGKVLRTTTDGEVPESNPYNDSYVYARGFRNPQGIDFHPENGDPYVAMHGPWRHDEINRVENGGNYGWPAYNCDSRYKDYVEAESETTGPVKCFDEWTIAPSGVTFVDDPDHEWYGSYFVAGLRGSVIYRVEFDENDEIENEEIFYLHKNDRIDNRIRNVEFHNGSLYMFGDGKGVGKLTPEETDRTILEEIKKILGL